MTCRTGWSRSPVMRPPNRCRPARSAAPRPRLQEAAQPATRRSDPDRGRVLRLRSALSPRSAYRLLSRALRPARVALDPAGRAQVAEFTRLVSVPAGRDASGAVMLADDGQLPAYPADPVRCRRLRTSALVGRGGGGHGQRAVDSQDAVSYSARQSFCTHAGRSQRPWAEHRRRGPGRPGPRCRVLSRNGDSSSTDSARLLDPDGRRRPDRRLAAHYTLRGRRRHGRRRGGRADRDPGRGACQRAARWWLDDETGIAAAGRRTTTGAAPSLSPPGSPVSGSSPTAEMMEPLPPRLGAGDRDDRRSRSPSGLAEQHGLDLRRAARRSATAAVAYRPDRRPDGWCTWSTATG